VEANVRAARPPPPVLPAAVVGQGHPEQEHRQGLGTSILPMTSYARHRCWDHVAGGVVAVDRDDAHMSPRNTVPATTRSLAGVAVVEMLVTLVKSGVAVVVVGVDGAGSVAGLGLVLG
jgi:hypothetical protein